jgi:hypothetical protein
MEIITQALNHKAGFEVVTSTPSNDQLRLVGRIPTNNIGTWLAVLERLLIYAEKAAWNVDLSKQYFMRGTKLLYGWRLIFQAEGVAQYAEGIAAIISQVPAVQRQLDEVKLYGGVDRTKLHEGKGAQPMFKAVVGPAAAAVRR